MKTFWLATCLCFLSVGCVSMSEDKDKKSSPHIHAQLPMEDIVVAGIEFGGETLQKAKQALKSKNVNRKASAFVRLKIIDNYKTWQTHELINSVNLYQNLTPEKGEDIFQLLVASDRPLAQELAWSLAAGIPSKAMKANIQKELVRYIEEDTINDRFNPQMAEAIANNGMKGSYTVLRLGLLETHDPAFAEAMIYFDPERASNDFLSYLAMAEPEQLRQITLASLNVLTCILILEHLSKVPADISNANFSSLFFFATSRNVGLSESGLKAVEAHLPNNTQRLAMMLSRMPTWVQISYVSKVGRQMLPITKALLNDLRGVSARSEVIYEIDAIKM